jgi:hypothetical protein
MISFGLLLRSQSLPYFNAGYQIHPTEKDKIPGWKSINHPGSTSKKSD